MVDKLNADCTGLNQYILTPANWTTVTYDPTSGATFELYGDGGTLGLNVIPNGVGSANVVIADQDYETTNTNLFNMGCSSLATDPNSSGSGDTGDGSSSSGSSGSSNSGVQPVQPSGHYEQRCASQYVPNPQWDPMAGPGVMAMKGINQYITQQQCQQVWVNY